jgi:hypothetical protein
MPKYQRRHYNDISKILKFTHAADDIIMEFASLFTQDNNNFDFIKFLEASGYKGCP